MILIIAGAQDVHALSVAKAINDRSPGGVAIVDAQDFPLRASISISPTGWWIETQDGRAFSSTETSALWWRRALAHTISDNIVDPTARRFAVNETASAFNTLPFWPGYLVVNPVDKEDVAGRKALQLNAARDVGLSVPPTMITNSPKVAREFCVEHERCIFKVLTSPISIFGETRRVTEDVLELLPSLTHAPVIFQREVRNKRDIRVTIVGNSIFAAEIAINNVAGKEFPDWRLDASAECMECELPAAICEKIRSLMTHLGLYYGAIDLIQTPEDEFFFLEVNPSGQFLFVEIDTGQPISRAFADLLLRGE